MKLIINKVTAFMATLAISIVTHAATAPASGQTYYGLFVGVNEYSNGVSSLFGCDRDVVNMLDAYTASGFCDASNAVTFLDYAATKDAVRAKFNELAGKAKSGDVVLYYQSSHGGDYDGDKGSCLCMADDDWSDAEFAEDLEKFVSGVRVVVIIDACHSGGMFKAAGASSRSVMRKRGFSFAARVQRHLKSRRESRKGTAAKGGVSVGWITACDWDELSTASPFGSIFTNAIIDGWRDGSADVDSDGYVSFSELAGYALDNVDYDEYGQTTQLDNDGLLSSVLAGRVYDMSVSHPLVLDKVFYGFIGTCPASVSIPAGIERIAESAFDADYNDVLALESVTIPASVTEIGACAFYECVNLETVTFEGDVADIWFDGGLSSVFFGTPWLEVNYPAPANDDFVDAQELPGSAGSVSGTTFGASVEDIEEDAGLGTSATVWYKWTADSSIVVEFKIPDVYRGIAIFAYNDDDELEELHCGERRIVFSAVGGETYYICVGNVGLGYVDHGSGDFEMFWRVFTVPVNDNFAEAEALVGESGSAEGWNVSATVEDGETYLCDTVATVWYKWTSELSDTVMFGVNADFDSIIGVYTGTSVGALVQVAFNDDPISNSGVYSSVTAFDSVAGQTYYIVVGGCGASTGSFELSWKPFANDFELDIDEDGILTGITCVFPPTDVVIPDGVTGIEEGVFEGLEGLRSVYIPASVTYIGESAFEGCTDLEEVIFEEKEPELIEWEWTDDDDVTHSGSYFGFDETLEIGAYAFAGCECLTWLDIPAHVSYVGESAFADCVSLESVCFLADDSVTDSYLEVDYGVFSGCEALASVLFEDRPWDPENDVYNAIYIGARAFEGCEALTDLYLGDGVEEIGDFAFYGIGIETLEIPASCYHIGEGAFAFCEYLDEVYYFGYDVYGDDYDIEVDEDSAFEGTPWISPPANDDFANAEELIGVTGSVLGKTRNATMEEFEEELTSPYGGYAGMTVWYKWKAEFSGDVVFYVRNMMGVYFYVEAFAYNNDGDLTRIDDWAEDSRRVGFWVEEGNEYYIRVDTMKSCIFCEDAQTGGAFEITWGLFTPPENDNFTAAEVLEGTTSGYVDGWTVSATVEHGESRRCNPLATVWYKWTPEVSCTVLFGVTSDYDSTIGVYSGASVDALVRIGFNDDLDSGDCDYACATAFDAVAGSTYYIAVGGCDGDKGSFNLEWMPYEYEDFEFDIDDNGVLTDFHYGIVMPPSLTIPEGVVAIAEDVFCEYNEILTINLPSTLKSIGAYAFAWCSDLTTVNGLTDTVEVGKQAFWSTPFDETRSFGLDIVDKCVVGFHGPCAEVVTIPEGVTNIAEYAFYYYDYGSWEYDEETDEEYEFSNSLANLTSVSLPSSIASISKWAFEGCTNLVTVTIGNPEILIDGSAFSGCVKLAFDVEKLGYSLVGWDLFREKNPETRVTDWDDDGNYIGWHWEEYEPDFMPTGMVVRVEDVLTPFVYGLPTDKLMTNWVWNVETEEYEVGDIIVVTNALNGVWATPVWDVNQYTLTFDAAGGSEVVPITQDYGTAVTTPAAPTRTGYAFAGWTPELPKAIPAEDVTYTAQWTVNQYTLTFDAAGGSEVAPITQDYGTAVTAPAAPTRTGYAFVGWTPELPETIPAEDVTYTAQWTVNKYTLTFDSAGGSVVAPITQDYGTAVAEPIAPVRRGYTFTGWSPALPATMPADGGAFTAQWTANRYTVTFDANGGKGAMAAQSYVYDEEQCLSECTFTRPAYEFMGWTLTPDSDVIKYFDGENILNMTAATDGKVTLYAVWERSTLWALVAVDDDSSGGGSSGGAEQGDEKFDGAAAETYDGYVYTEDGVLKGTVQVKAAKAKLDRKTDKTVSKITVAIQLVGEKKVTVKGDLDLATAKFEATAGGRALSLAIGANGVTGKYGAYYIDGAQNKFTSKNAADKQDGAAALAHWQGVYTLACKGVGGWSVYSLTVASKGKVKVQGVLSNGTKVSVTSQLLVGDGGVCAIPVVIAKKANVAFNVWMTDDGVEVVGLDGEVAVGRLKSLKGGAHFSLDDGATFSALLGDGTYAEYLPDALAVAQNGTKLVVANGAKVGKVQLRKGATSPVDVDDAKAGVNPSALKLTYTAKTGMFKGSFKAYRLVKGKPKAVTVTVTGVLVDGKGYGTVSIKKPALSLPFTIE